MTYTALHTSQPALAVAVAISKLGMGHFWSLVFPRWRSHLFCGKAEIFFTTSSYSYSVSVKTEQTQVLDILSCKIFSVGLVTGVQKYGIGLYPDSV